MHDTGVALDFLQCTVSLAGISITPSSMLWASLAIFSAAAALAQFPSSSSGRLEFNLTVEGHDPFVYLPYEWTIEDYARATNFYPMGSSTTVRVRQSVQVAVYTPLLGAEFHGYLWHMANNGTEADVTLQTGPQLKAQTVLTRVTPALMIGDTFPATAGENGTTFTANFTGDMELTEIKLTFGLASNKCARQIRGTIS